MIARTPARSGFQPAGPSGAAPDTGPGRAAARSIGRNAPAPAPSAAPVALTIDRLSLHGLRLDAAQATRLQASVERELARLLKTAPPAAAGAALDRVPGLGIRIDSPIDPARLGNEIARSVHRALLGNDADGATA